MTVRRGKIMFVIGLILAIGGLSGAGPQVLNPRPAQATTTGCTPSSDLFGCIATGTSGTWGFKVENNSTVNYSGAIYARATNTSGITHGIHGETLSPIGRAVSGYATSSTGENFGVMGRSNSSGGYGTWGYAASTTGTNYGAYGRTDSGGGYGVYGAALGSGSGTGVAGVSTSGRGVYGSSSSNSGVYGSSSSSNGVYGSSSSGTGVYGQGSTAVYGLSTDAAGNWAGYFQGNVYISGTLTVGGGAGSSFLIDHPLDPANKYLSHIAVESPDMLNIYNGTVTTDAQGNATVVMPGYFEALNRDFQYQLTVIGTFAQAIVASEISNNQFTIQTDQPNTKVSWQVTGIRNDPYAQQHTFTVERLKSGNEQGKYLHPKEYGQPATNGITRYGGEH